MALIKDLLIVALVFLLVFASGCATIVHGRSQEFTLNSSPNGAKVSIDDGAETVTTPSIVTLKRYRDHTFDFTDAGYQPQVEIANRQLSGWVLGNLLLGGVIGAGVDLYDGAAWTFDNPNVNVQLNKAPTE